MAEVNYDMPYCVQKWDRLVQQLSSHLLSKFTDVVLVQRTYMYLLVPATQLSRKCGRTSNLREAPIQ